MENIYITGSEIDNFDVSFFDLLVIEHNIFRFKIPMHYMLSMAVIDGSE
jgi:hypothetical protein